MDLGFCIQILWPLATAECKASDSPEIAPGHILCAALKVAEIPPTQFEDALPSKDAFAALEQEHRDLVACLEKRSVHVPNDSAALRRKLRKALAAGGNRATPEGGRPAHRSTDSKAIFALAEKTARENGDQTLGANRLVEAALAMPGEALAKVLAQCGVALSGGQSHSVEKAPEWIDAFGRDLTKLARDQGVNPDLLQAVRRDAVCRVLGEALFSNLNQRRQPVLLVSRGSRRSEAVVGDLAAWLASSNPPENVTQGHLVEIDSAVILRKDKDGDPEERLERLFRECEGWKDTALFFSSFHRYLTPAIAGERVPRRLQSLLNGTTCATVAGVTMEQYVTHIQDSQAWRGTFRLLWIHDRKTDFVL